MMKQIIPLVKQNDIEHEFGYRKAAFESAKKSGIDKIVFLIFPDPGISTSFLPNTFCVLQDLDEYCQRFDITPTYAFPIKVWEDDRFPKILIPTTEMAMRSFLCVIARSKKDDIILSDINELLVQNRKEYLIGESIFDYQYCPYKYRPFQFQDKLYCENAAEHTQERSMWEKSILFYDFFYSEATPKTIFNKYDESLFSEKSRKHNIPFVIFPRIAEDGWSSFSFKIHSIDDIINNTEQYDKNLVDSIFAVDLICNRIGKYNISKIIKELTE